MPLNPFDSNFFYYLALQPSSNSGGVSAAQVADLIVPGSGLTETIDPTTGRITLSTTGGGSTYTPPITQFASIFGDLLSLPFQDGLIFCAQYWPGAAATGGTGGTFKAAQGTALTVDNVRIFAGSGCRWVRQSTGSTTAEDAGCINRGGTNTGDYKLFQNPQTQFAAMPLLSDKFGNLAAAQAWYPGARLNNPAKVERGETAATAFATSVNNAALQHALTLYPISAKKGIYRFNRPIECLTGMSLEGDGGVSSLTVFVFEANNAVIPRRSSALAATNPQDEIYKSSVKIAGIRFVGSDVIVPNNSNEQPNLVDTSTFDELKSGFWSPRRNPDLNLAEALDATPLFSGCTFSDCCFDRFLGHGFSLANGFANKIYIVNNNNNKGFGLHTLDGNSTVQERCYTGRFNSSGGIWAENGGELRACTGYDHFDDIRPGIVFGRPGSVQGVRAKVVDGNIEGIGKWGVQMHGNGGSLEFDNTDLQWYCTDVANAPIRIYGGINLITLNFKVASYAGISPVKLKPTNLIMSKGNGNQFVVKKPMKFGASDLTYVCVNDAGIDDIYNVNMPLLVPASDGFANNAQFGLLLNKQKPTLAERLWVGNTTAAREFLVQSKTQNLNATGNLTAWDTILTIGATPLTANAVITLPTIVGKIGQSVRVVRLDSAAFTVSFVFAIAGESFVAVLGAQLDTQGGSVLLTPVSATKVLVS